MDEIVPVILGAVLGALVWRTTNGRMRAILSVLAVVAAGAFATILSGEFQLSWVYFLIDFSEAALGLVIGIALVRFFLPRRAADISARAQR
ncbi:hypothetical protein [Mesorhizobium shangrilense]|uniref:GlsB/YeaQ/YmgE family stress response membrane protein n=1 Tax=Mesorhizobium shangrilense TaxID=460060 RepID=A0ABV2D671_9HYPH